MSSIFCITGNTPQLVSNTILIQKDELNHDNSSLIVGGTASVVGASGTKGVHIGYDSTSNAGSIYALNGSSGIASLYLNMPTTYTGAGSVNIGGDLNLSASGSINKGGNLFAHNELNSTFVGTNAGKLNAGLYNSAFGSDAMSLGPVSGQENSAFGSGALRHCTSGMKNVAIGNGALDNCSTGNYNTAVGYCSMQIANITGSENCAIGSSSLSRLTSGSKNVALGNGAAAFLTTGIYNTAVGYLSMGAGVCTGSENCAIGSSSLANVSTGNKNVALGNGTSSQLTTGVYNTAIGHLAMGNGIVVGTENVALGSSSLINMTSGSRNIGLGNGSLTANISGSDNIAIGYIAGQFLTNGNKNILIGKYAASAYNGTESNNIIVGSQAGMAGENNVIRIGSVSTSAYIQGINGVNIGSAKMVGVSGTDQIGNSNTLIETDAVINTNQKYQIGGSDALTGNTVFISGSKLESASVVPNTYNLPNKVAGIYTISTTDTAFMTLSQYVPIGNVALAAQPFIFQFQGLDKMALSEISIVCSNDTSNLLSFEIHDITNGTVIASTSSGTAGIHSLVINTFANLTNGKALWQLFANIDTATLQGSFYSMTLN